MCLWSPSLENVLKLAHPCEHICSEPRTIANDGHSDWNHKKMITENFKKKQKLCKDIKDKVHPHMHLCYSCWQTAFVCFSVELTDIFINKRKSALLVLPLYSVRKYLLVSKIASRNQYFQVLSENFWTPPALGIWISPLCMGRVLSGFSCIFPYYKRHAVK